MTAKEIGHFPVGHPSFYQSALFLICVRASWGVLLCGMVQILVLIAQPWHQSDLDKSSFPFFEPGYLPHCLIQYPFTIQENLSIMA